MFRVHHLDHSGSLLGEFQMVGGSLKYSFRAGSPGDISYQLANSDSGITRDSFAPYVTDFLLQYQDPQGGTWKDVMGGIHVPVNLKNDEDAVNVAGKDWAHWLEQPYWFDYYSVDYLDAGATYATRQRDIIKANRSYPPGIHDYIAAAVFYPPATVRQTVDHLIQNTQRGTDFVEIVPGYHGNVANDALAPQATLVIQFQDQTTVLQHINTLASFGDPYGFDWTMNPGKTMEFFGPRKEVKYSPTPIWTITKDMIVGDLAENPMLDLDWTNNGPLATHLVGVSNGSPGPWWHKRDQQSVDKYREWLRIETLGDQYWRGKDMLHALDGLDYLHTQKDLTITVLPTLLGPNAFLNHIGDVIRIKWDFPPYHEVNAFYWINGQDYDSDGEEWKMTLGLQQIYD